MAIYWNTLKLGDYLSGFQGKSLNGLVYTILQFNPVQEFVVVDLISVVKEGFIFIIEIILEMGLDSLWWQ